MSDDNNEEFPGEFESVDLNLVEVGGVYPLYGMITDIIEEGDDMVLVQINANIDAKIVVNSPEKINILKERAFEPALFVSKVLAKGDRVFVDCEQVIFGKKPEVTVQ